MGMRSLFLCFILIMGCALTEPVPGECPPEPTPVPTEVPEAPDSVTIVDVVGVTFIRDEWFVDNPENAFVLRFSHSVPEEAIESVDVWHDDGGSLYPWPSQITRYDINEIKVLMESPALLAGDLIVHIDNWKTREQVFECREPFHGECVENGWMFSYRVVWNEVPR